MPFTSQEHRMAVVGAGRPWLRSKLPNSFNPVEWRVSSGNGVGFHITAPSASTFNTAIVQKASESVNATDVSYTSSGFGTPDGMMLFYGSGSADDTVVDNAQLSVGATDKTNQRAVSFLRTNAQGFSDCNRDISTSHIGTNLTLTGTRSGSITYKETTTDGLTCTWDDGTNTKQTTGLLLKSNNLWVGSATLGTQDTDATLTPGFKADVIIVFSNNATAAGAFANQSVGFAVYNGSTYDQCSAFVAATDNQDFTDPTSYVHATRCGGQVSASALSYSVEAHSRTSTTFKLTPRDGDSNDTFMVLALNIGNAQSWTGVIDTPTSTGNDSNTTPGFKPKFGMHVMTAATATGTIQTNAAAGSYGISVFNSAAQRSHAISDEDNQDTSDTSSIYATKLAHMLNDGNTDAVEGSFVSFDATGWTTNYTNLIGASALKWPTLVIEDTTVAGGGLVGFLSLMGVGI